MLERQSAGIALAKEQGKFKGRPINPKTDLKCKEAITYVSKAMSKEKAAKAAGVGIATLYRYIKGSNG